MPERLRLQYLIMIDPLDNELLALVNKLTKIQKTVGGAKGKNSATDDHEGKMDRFLDLRDQMTERLMNLKDIFENIQRMEKSPGKRIIACAFIFSMQEIL